MVKSLYIGMSNNCIEEQNSNYLL